MKKKVKSSNFKNLNEENFQGGFQRDKKMKPLPKAKYSKQFYNDVDEDDDDLDDLNLFGDDDDFDENEDEEEDFD